MRISIVLSFIILFYSGFTQPINVEKTAKDSLLIIPKNLAMGFFNGYLLFIPKGTLLNNKTFLLVEPNNTGALSDSIEVHERAAIHLATVSSVGNNISTELKIPLLVPVFPRPEKDSLMYTHALDRDVMLEKSPALTRLDLQLLKMIDDARQKLLAMNINVDQKFFMNGFSASGTFTNRFSLIHPEKIKALAIGGFNGELMLPQEKINNKLLDYPLGINDYSKLFHHSFNLESYKAIPQFIYLGKLDENDAVQYDDAYSEKERKIINENIGNNVQERFIRCQQLYHDKSVEPIFTSYENIGHWTTGAVNLDVIKFFYKQMKLQ